MGINLRSTELLSKKKKKRNKMFSNYYNIHQLSLLLVYLHFVINDKFQTDRKRAHLKTAFKTVDL